VSVAAPAESIWRTLRRGLALSPELYRGLAVTLALATLMTAGRAAVPVAVQVGIDDGVRAPGGPDLDVVAAAVAVAAAFLLGGTISGYVMLRRLFTVSETALAAVRVRVFAHVHRLSMRHLETERRGALVSRATGDVDQMTSFLQWNGVVLLICVGQVFVTTVVMAVYSWQLTLVVLAVFAPVVVAVRVCMRRLAGAYTAMRRRSATMLAAVAESVVGAEVIRGYNASERTAARLDRAVDDFRLAGERATRLTVTAYSLGELASGAALAGTVVVGVLLGIDGGLTVGQLTAFLFLVALFVLPAQVAAEMLNGMQNAVAGWRRVLDVLDIEPEVAEAKDACDLPPGPLSVRLAGLRYAYVSGPPVLTGVDLDIAAGTHVAVVGATGAGKTTIAKLIVRLMDPVGGEVLLAGVPVARVRFASLRERVVMVPQDGFLFDGTVADNVRFGRDDLTPERVSEVFADLTLADWVAGLPDGLDTRVGERGAALSVGERQLVALARAHAAAPGLLVLDEATSAVDPAADVRLRDAIAVVARGRTTVTIAHRLATAESADDVVVVADGRIVQRGRHADLVADPDSVYGRLHASWLRHTPEGDTP
jgi:ABC-type multidrug transport system fused ATPase/permease subunit